MFSINIGSDIHRYLRHTYTIPSQSKPSFTRYPVLTIFLVKKGYCRNEGLPLGDSIHFYTILDTFIRSRTLSWDPEHSYTITSQTLIPEISLFNHIFLAKKNIMLTA